MQLALGLMCQPTQNGAFQAIYDMVFRYRQVQDNNACQREEVDFYPVEFFFPPLCHHPRSLWPAWTRRARTVGFVHSAGRSNKATR